MEDVEIDSFLKKFKMLRNAGYNASLNFESKLGEVFISLNCKVGRLLPPPTSPASVVSKQRSPSYYRRLAHRKAVRDLGSESSVVAEQVDVASNNVINISEDTEEAEADDGAEGSTVIIVENEEDGADAETSDNEEDNVEDENVSHDTEISEDISEQLDALIQESKNQRERWDRLKDSEPNG